jgi:hypothetical protein
MLLMTLIDLRQSCAQEFLGWLLIELDKSNVARNIALLLPILEAALLGSIRAKPCNSTLTPRLEVGIEWVRPKLQTPC